jgi:rubrerythrin
MAAFFGKEIMEAAIQIEKNGEVFYSNVSRQQFPAAVKEVFAFLAEEERRHIAQFEQLASGLSDPEETWREREEYSLYLEELASLHVFKDDGSGEIRARQVKSASEATEVGIQFEKDTILFFGELHNLVRRADHHVVDALIGWEKDHLVRLVRLRRELEASQRR